MLSIFLNPYFINITLILFLFIFLKYLKVDNKLINRIIIIVSAINWIFLSGFRALNVGADTINYKNMFERTSFTSWNEIFGFFLKMFSSRGQGRDPGYELIVKTIQLISLDYQVFLFIIAIITIVPLSIWIHKNSKEPLTSFMVFNVLFFSFFAITGIRQTLAMVLIVFIGYRFVLKRKLIPFLITSFIAFTIHKSAIVFVPFYFLSNVKSQRWHLYLALLMFGFLMIFRNQYFKILAMAGGFDNYDVYASGGPKVFTLLLAGIILLIIWKVDFNENNPKTNSYINATILALLLLPISWVNPSAMRVVMYFSVFLMVLIPLLFERFKHQEKALVYASFFVVILINFLTSIPNYNFFWDYSVIIGIAG